MLLPPPPPCPAGDLEPTAGESRRSHKLRIGRYNQHFVDALAFDENPVEYLMNKFPEAGLKPEGMRAMLGRFGLSGHHHLTPIVKLSGEAAGRGGWAHKQDSSSNCSTWQGWQLWHCVVIAAPSVSEWSVLG